MTLLGLFKNAQIQGVRKAATGTYTKVREDCGCSGQRSSWHFSTVPLKIGTRGSKLALTQARHVISKLKIFHPTLSIELKVIKTSGDILKTKNLASVGGKGLFVKELEEALKEGLIDVAIHSLKDVPGDLSDSFSLLFFGEREDPRDCFVSLKYSAWDALPKGAKVGTSSPRRRAALLKLRSDLLIEPIRGNVDTRLKKLGNGEYDAIVLAAAGLKRLGKESAIRHVFDSKLLIPAVGQGVVAIEFKKENFEKISFLFRHLEKQETSVIAKAERTFLKEMGGDCYTPLGGHAWFDKGKLHLIGWLADFSGKKNIQEHLCGEKEEAEVLGKEMASKILLKGGKEILNEIADHARKESKLVSSEKA